MKLAVVLAAALTFGLGACGDGDPSVASATADDTAPTSTGVIAVRPVPTAGRFIEGFEAGLRFETAAGEVLSSTLWSDFVQAHGTASLDAFYESILEVEVPAGTAVVLATVTIGPGGPPATPDLDGPLDCRLEVEVAADGRVDLQLGFDSTADGCLRLAP